jgi:hypothetical protein
MLVTGSLYGQKYFRGYLILKGGKLKKVYIQRPANTEDAYKEYLNVQYRTTVTAPIQSYSANDIMGYMVGSEEFYSISLSGNQSGKVFAKVVGKGDVELMKYQTAKGATENYIFKKEYESQYYLYAPSDKTLQKGNEVLFSAAGLSKKRDIKKVNEQFVGFFSRYFDSCTDVKDKLISGYYLDNSMEAMVKAYNSCE